MAMLERLQHFANEYTQPHGEVCRQHVHQAESNETLESTRVLNLINTVKSALSFKVLAYCTADIINEMIEMIEMM